MANPTENLSPEEKLLRVIQGGKKAKVGGPEGVSAATGAATGAATAVTAVPVTVTEARPAAVRAAEPVADKPKLKVAKGAEAIGAPTVTTTAAKGDAKADAKKRGTDPKAAKRSAAAGSASRPKSSEGGGDFSVRTVNIVLAVSVLIVLFMTGHEIWANVRVQETNSHVGPVSLPLVDMTKADAEIRPLDDVLDAVDQRLLFAVVTPGPDPTPVVVVEGPDKYCSLMGISMDANGKPEAIIQDNKSGNMQFLKVGDSIVGDGQDWIVHEIQGEQVIFRNGNKESVVRGPVSRQL